MQVQTGLDISSLWNWAQRRFFALLTICILLTLAYILAIVVPKLGSTMVGSPVIPGVPAVGLVILVIHIATAIPPLFLGLIAFSTRARRYSGRLHRWIGTVYCVAIWISAVTGGILAYANQHGSIAQLGFGTLAVAWFTTTYVAYTTARAKDFVNHRLWMIRSFGLTLAVVSVRPMFFFGPPTGLDAETWYQVITWLCWMPNLIAAEIYARITLYSGRLVMERKAQRRPTADMSRPDTMPAT
ncbi:MAG: DUF2306 domain-containing protein [Pseudomonadota bacterium]